MEQAGILECDTLTDRSGSVLKISGHVRANSISGKYGIDVGATAMVDVINLMPSDHISIKGVMTVENWHSTDGIISTNANTLFLF